MNEMTPTERAAVVAIWLTRGETLTPADVARLTKCELRSGYRVLERLSRVLPLVEAEGRWSLLRDNLFFETD